MPNSLYGLQADEDLYGDLPVVNGGIDEEPPALETQPVAVEAPDAAGQDVRLDEPMAALPDTGAIKAEADTVEHLSVESAFTQIAEALGLKDAAPGDVVSAFSHMAAQAQQQPNQPLQTVQERMSSVVDQVQVSSEDWP